MGDIGYRHSGSRPTVGFELVSGVRIALKERAVSTSGVRCEAIGLALFPAEVVLGIVVVVTVPELIRPPSARQLPLQTGAQHERTR